MSYNILGISIGHNASACVLSDGELVYFLEEERLSKLKRDSNPFRVMVDICINYKIDELVITGTNSPKEYNRLVCSGEFSYFALVRKFYPKVKITLMNHEHHLCHVLTSFFNSGFKEAIGITIDAAGSLIPSKKYKEERWESESVYKISYSNGIEKVYKRYGIYSKHNPSSSLIGIGRTYGGITTGLGFDPLEGGKTMGLSSYGKPNSNIPPLFINNQGNNNFIYSGKNGITSFNFQNYPKLKPKFNSNNKWHNDPLKKYNWEADLAFHAQQEFQKEIAFIIQNTLSQYPYIKHIVCAGGCFLNCVANYYLTKLFPDVKFYFEPISNDAGTSIGAAQYVWFYKTQDKKIRPLKSLYLGPQYSKNQLLEGIKKYVSN
jgi:carbamoyltransferase